MPKVLVEYNKESGYISMPDGTEYFAQMNLDLEEYIEPKGFDIDAIVALKNAGFTASEIIEMKKEGLV